MSSEGKIVQGSIVKLHGLVGAAHLNGSSGFITGSYGDCLKGMLFDRRLEGEQEISIR